MKKGFFTIAAVLLATMALNAAPIDGLYNTGVDNSGNVLAKGASDSHWSIVSPDQQAVVLDAYGTWIDDSYDTSRWIWQQDNRRPLNVTLEFQTTFCIEDSFDLSTAIIDGRFAVDDRILDIYLNGLKTGISTPPLYNWYDWTEFSITDGFVTGDNVLSFIVQDIGTVAGLRVEFSSNIEPRVDPGVVPEPSTWILLGTGLLFAGVAGRHRFSTNK